LEAFVVYYVDHMDADIGGYNIILEENKSGSDWSDYVKNFERSVFLKKLELPGDEDSENIKRVVDSKPDRDNTKTYREEKQQEELF